MLYESESGDLTLVASGDTMITRRLSVFREERFLALADLFRRADVGFTNLEMLIHRYEHPPGLSDGTYTASDPSNLEELKWAGINMVSCANNHHFDYGEGGTLTNLANLEAAGMVNAGTGRNLSEARAPGYLDTPKGRVALISTASTFKEAGQALNSRPDAKGRPGLNPQRFDTSYVVDRPAFDELRRISQDLGLEARKEAERKFAFTGNTPGDTDTEFHFLKNRFVLGEEFAIKTVPHAGDMAENLKWIRDARRMADWVLVSFHSHERGVTREDPPDFLITFARACIDEGADAFFGHGPHFLKGVEIYNGKPIFYSLGNYIFQNDTVRWQPSHNYELMKLDSTTTPADFYDARSANDSRGFPVDSAFWEAVVAECEYSDNKLKQVKLHPVDMGFGRSRPQRGRPLLADGELGRKILERVARLSEPFGTKVEIEDGVGIVRP